ncbi:PrpR N-terminal domain-containing protein [Pseudoflavonifractor sp. MSJ-37]|uniref:PrpR N-terminal domain-containing protein n=1 Tax=Pseudoflavonifractor sp. MSJ-37 TaxID=2841531 RepID=UPI001C118CE7|nr:PrpR N-terminal domain-containing protein [Pseudoflavonifractor sp. MSJ-37]MBU5434012.1 PrpR N-terminal domain-containing protein [Pseudoflavonifractor sp. MSJ-37]
MAEDKIRILGIVPYDGMKTLMLNVAAEYPQIEMDVAIGNMEQAAEIARQRFHSGYDLILSRGGTARLLRQYDLPVVEVDISLYDILRALRLSNGLEGKVAMVVYADIGTDAQTLCDLLGFNIDIVQAHSIDELEPLLRQLQKQEYTTVLSDTVANLTAKRIGLNSILITSGPESIERALKSALALCCSHQYLRRENRFLRQVLDGQEGIAVLDPADREFIFSTLEAPPPALLDELKELAAGDESDPEERQYSRHIRGTLYLIRRRRLRLEDQERVVFYVKMRRFPIAPAQLGLRSISRQEAVEATADDAFNYTSLNDDLQKHIIRLTASTQPLVIGGEYGTERDQLVSRLYAQGRLRGSALGSINCALVNDKGWKFLLEHHDSPLMDPGNVLYFSSVDTLSSDRLQQLVALLEEIDGSRSRRLIFSCGYTEDHQLSANGRWLLDRLNGLSLIMPPLREMKDTIPTLLRLTLSHLSTDATHPVLGASEGAIRLLQEYRWPHNYYQFRRIVKELTVVATGQTITEDDVRQVLKGERYECISSQPGAKVMAPLDLSQPLHDIDREIIRRVVEEMGGNQTAAAKRLGISRTTLWRFLREK